MPSSVQNSGLRGGVQHGAAAVDDIRDAAQIHLHQIPVDQAVVPPVDAENLHAPLRAVRTTARTAAFMPGASPPLVSTAIFLMAITNFSPIHPRNWPG